MGCPSCGKGRRVSKDLPIIDKNNKLVAENYQKLKKTSRVQVQLREVQTQAVNPVVKTYSNIKEIQYESGRVSVLDYDIDNKCVYIIGTTVGCGACNYMKRLLNNIKNREINNNIIFYSIERSITEQKGFSLSGNPTILLVNKGKLVFQLGGIYNDIVKTLLNFARNP